MSFCISSYYTRNIQYLNITTQLTVPAGRRQRLSWGKGTLIRGYSRRYLSVPSLQVINRPILKYKKNNDKITKHKSAAGRFLKQFNILCLLYAIMQYAILLCSVCVCIKIFVLLLGLLQDLPLPVKGSHRRFTTLLHCDD